ncbi:unnamed protein product [Linum tenue]|uniref:HMG box domain-containing protein n=1 Tax=Linum tenue TaxID=586396 RepID=A0AAV0K1C1_9ROSI|nr:unnamed protein product [Linum tenue]
MKVSKGRGSKDKNEAIVEDRKSAGKRKAVGKVSESRNSSSSSKRRTGSVNNFEKQASAKDPNKPKRPASAFFVFLYQLVRQSVVLLSECKIHLKVGKAGGEKWKSLSSEVSCFTSLILQKTS